jgi:Fur family zinc uptake transcriptional regulator
MEDLWPRGVRAATTVYRSLHRLTDLGLVHRLESVNAYVACAHNGDHTGVVFAICEICGNVTEFMDAKVSERLGARARAEQFLIEHAMLELKGRCRLCAKDAKR